MYSSIVDRSLKIFYIHFLLCVMIKRLICNKSICFISSIWETGSHDDNVRRDTRWYNTKYRSLGSVLFQFGSPFDIRGPICDITQYEYQESSDCVSYEHHFKNLLFLLSIAGTHMYNKNVFIISFFISDFTFIGQNYSSLVIFMSYRFFLFWNFWKIQQQ